MDSNWILLLAGTVGALVREILREGGIELPKKIGGKLFLGFIGSAIVGGFVGYLIDGSVVTAALAGYTGISAIENLLLKKQPVNSSDRQTIENLIRAIAKQECVDPELAVRVAKAESNLDPLAKHKNPDGSLDRGLYQINNKWHPEVSDSEAYDPTFAAQFFCKAFKAGNLSWWNASKAKWNIA